MKTNVVKAAVLAAGLLVQAGVHANPARFIAGLRNRFFSEPARRAFYRTPASQQSDCGFRSEAHVKFLEKVGFRFAVGSGLSTLGMAHYGIKSYKANKEIQKMRDEIYEQRREYRSMLEKRDSIRAKNDGQINFETERSLMVQVINGWDTLADNVADRDPAIQAARKASAKANELAAQRKAELAELLNPKQPKQ